MGVVEKREGGRKVERNSRGKVGKEGKEDTAYRIILTCKKMYTDLQCHSDQPSCFLSRM